MKQWHILTKSWTATAWKSSLETAYVIKCFSFVTLRVHLIVLRMYYTTLCNLLLFTHTLKILGIKFSIHTGNRTISKRWWERSHCINGNNINCTKKSGREIYTGLSRFYQCRRRKVENCIRPFQEKNVKPTEWKDKQHVKSTSVVVSVRWWCLCC